MVLVAGLGQDTQLPHFHGVPLFDDFCGGYIGLCVLNHPNSLVFFSRGSTPSQEMVQARSGLVQLSLPLDSLK